MRYWVMVPGVVSRRSARGVSANELERSWIVASVVLRDAGLSVHGVCECFATAHWSQATDEYAGRRVVLSL